MADFISIIIPIHNGSKTIGSCLKAALASRYPDFEVIVVDDGSDDNSVDIIKNFPCKLIQLQKHAGASRARNIGASEAQGDILFFTDADCLLEEGTLAIACNALTLAGPKTVIGGTYTCIPYDNTFFSRFQSIFINHFETKRAANPDYVATHAMIIHAESFRENSGFSEQFLPIIEDVELSHRLRRHGYRLAINPEILVQHIFNFSLSKSLLNALRKSMYWTIYSIRNKDLLVDSGTASIELKTNVISYFLIAILLLVFLLVEQAILLPIIVLAIGVNVSVNWRLFQAFYRTGGCLFSIGASVYYLLLYPLAIGIGAIGGAVKYFKILFNERVNA
ncbi:MAG TPA: glycosyltransferase [Acidiferrobacteraceae bacterium]|nr:glycosyltransferase [Acidiferrobacteraceae bacterium]HEX20589.1 glycosyltransferase [Acidiferrobacteraceae bacterium]